MLPTNEHIKRLLEKYTADEHTAQEYKELLTYMGVQGGDEDVEELLFKTIESIESYSGVTEERLTRVTDQAYVTLQKRIQIRRPKTRYSTIRLYIPYAAALLLFISVWGFWYVDPFGVSSSTELTSQFGEDIMPGGNHAYITLSDGRQIALDSTQSGLTALHGVHTYANGDELFRINETEYAIFNTPVGGEYQLTLPDGTKAWLNANSSLKYPMAFAGGQRLVEVTGEVYFEVAHDAKKPFLVESRGQRIKVLGTAFNLRNYNQEQTVTTLIEGKVSLFNTQSKKEVILLPNQQVVLTSDRMQIVEVDALNYVAWKDGLLVNQQASLMELCQEIERWYGVTFVFPEDFGNHERAFISIHRKEKLSSLLAALQNAYQVTFQIKGKEVLVR